MVVKISKTSWPMFPKVVVVDNQIVIHFENGTMHYWGVEDCEEERLHIVSDIQNGLRAIHYISNCLDLSISDCVKVLRSKGYSNKQAEEYLGDALRKILYARCERSLIIRDEVEPVSRPFYIN